MKKAILIGVGGFGELWRDAITQHNIKIVGIVDISKENLINAREYFKLSSNQCYLPGENWESCNADFILDCSPFKYHLDNARRAFQNGMHVLTVKPLSSNLDEALEMINLQKYYNLKGMVAHQKRFYPVFRRLSEIVKENVIGEIKHVKVEMYLSGLGWEPGYQWRSKISEPTLYEATIHHLDIFQSVFKSEIKNIFYHSFNPPWSPFQGNSTISALLETENDIFINYNATFAAKEDRFVAFDSGWIIEGTDGVIRIDNGEIYINGELESILPVSPPLEELNCIVLTEFLSYLNEDLDHELSFENNLKSFIPLMCFEESKRQKKWINTKEYKRSVK
ncbi:Gfo/Idh/MocA family protein [Bacillus sp. CH_442]|uniref:Gfo/Idh/MocA family protein n=1 Tax=Bacillus sp. CH_442 TaxID=2978217 RepID=UPI0030F62315|nr:Gfo/Idh/MocA family oxidoreductase [Bacillus thuringiensis]